MLETIKNIRKIVIKSIMKNCADEIIEVNEALMMIAEFEEDSKEVSGAIMKYHEACMKYVDAKELQGMSP